MTVNQRVLGSSPRGGAVIISLSTRAKAFFMRLTEVFHFG